MSKAYEFLRECGYFYVLFINKDFPAGRPFGAVMECDNKLYISLIPKSILPNISGPALLSSSLAAAQGITPYSLPTHAKSTSASISPRRTLRFLKKTQKSTG